MFKFYSLFLVAVVSFMPLAQKKVHAQEDAEAVLAEMAAEEQAEEKKEIKPLPDGEESYTERLALSHKMHEIWPIRPKIENALDVVSQQIQPDKRLEFKSGMRRAISFEALEEQSIEAMADIFTVEELRAMIDFYGSKEGRSVSHKTTDYEQALLPLMTKMIDKALLDSKLGTQ